MELPAVSPSSSEGPLNRQHQLYRLVLAVIALLYAGYSYLRDDFYIMSKHSQGSHYHGVAAGLLETMLVLVAAACLLPVIGVYDARPGRPDYELWRRRSAMAAYALMSMGITLKLFNPTLAMVDGVWPWLFRWGGWLGLGALAAQLGRLPPSYLKKGRQQQNQAGSEQLSPVVAYIAAAFLSLISVAFLALAGFVQWRSPMSGWGFKLVFVSLGLGFGAWTVSILRRAKSTPNPAPSAPPPSVPGESKWPW